MSFVELLSVYKRLRAFEARIDARMCDVVAGRTSFYMAPINVAVNLVREGVDEYTRILRAAGVQPE